MVCLGSFKDENMEPVLLKYDSSNGSSRHLSIRHGQIVLIGSSNSADFKLPAHSTVAPEHCEIAFLNSKVVAKSLSRSRPVILNDSPIKEAIVSHGDRITMGRVLFTVQLFDVPDELDSKSETQVTRKQPSGPTTPLAPSSDTESVQEKQVADLSITRDKSFESETGHIEPATNFQKHNSGCFSFSMTCIEEFWALLDSASEDRFHVGVLFNHQLSGLVGEQVPQNLPDLLIEKDGEFLDDTLYLLDEDTPEVFEHFAKYNERNAAALLIGNGEDEWKDSMSRLATWFANHAKLKFQLTEIALD